MSIKQIIKERVQTPQLRDFLLSCVAQQGIEGIDENPREILVLPWLKTEKSSKQAFLRIRTEEGDVQFQEATVHIVMRYTRKALFRKNPDTNKWDQIRKFYKEAVDNNLPPDTFVGTKTDLLLYDASGKVYLYEVRKVREFTVMEAITKLQEIQSQARPIYGQFTLRPKLVKDRYDYIVPVFEFKGISELPPSVLADLELIKQHILFKKGSIPTSPFMPYNNAKEEDEEDEIAF